MSLRTWLHEIQRDARTRGYKGLLVVVDHPAAPEGGGSVFYSSGEPGGAAAAREGLSQWESSRGLDPNQDRSKEP